MKTIKTNIKLKNIKGEDLKNEEDKIITVGEVISTVLSGRVANPTLAWQLGKKFACDPKVDLKAEDVVYIKSELEKNGQHEWGYGAVIIGQIIEILESSSDVK